MNQGLLSWPRGQEVVRRSHTSGFTPRWPMERAEQRIINMQGVLTAAGSANTKGSYTQIGPGVAGAAPLPCDTEWMTVQFWRGGANRENLTDIAIDVAGGSTPTQIILENLHWFGRPANGILSNGDYLFDIFLPAGTTVFARTQCTTLSSAFSMNIELGYGAAPMPGPLRALTPYAAGPQGIVTSYGPDTSDSGLVLIDPGATPGTKGAWTQLAASLLYETRSIHFKLGNRLNTARSECAWGIDLGLGPPGQEFPVLENLPLEAQTSTNCVWPPMWPIPLVLPAGERLSARATVTSGAPDATDRLFDLGIYAQS